MDETTAQAEAAKAESRNADANAAEAAAKVQEALLAKAVAEGAKLLEPRIIKMEKWQDDHTLLFASLATKEDIAQIVQVFGNIKTAASILSIGGRYGFKTILTIAGFITAILIIIGGFKTALAALFAWATLGGK